MGPEAEDLSGRRLMALRTLLTDTASNFANREKEGRMQAVMIILVLFLVLGGPVLVNTGS